MGNINNTVKESFNDSFFNKYKDIVYIYEKEKIMKKNEAIINNYFLEEIKGDALSNDPDNTKISREFYAEYWAKPFGADINLYNGKNNNYRGETIISFNTIAGALIRMTRRYENNGYSIEENSNNKDSERLEYIISSDEDFIDEKLKKSFKEFNQLFHSLSNFMPLVKTEIGSNLNNVKARGKYHDFPDIFLKDIQNYYKGEDSNPKFNVKVNSEYFEKFGSWKNFVEWNVKFQMMD